MHDDQAPKQTSDAKVGLETSFDEPPPSYTPPTGSVASESDGSLSSTFKTKPTNFLALHNGPDSVRGEFVIDSCIQIPSSVLPPLGDGETEADRKNLSLKSRDGSIHADIWLLSSSKESSVVTQRSQRTTIALAANHGSINAQLHTFDGSPPFSLTATAPHGTIRLALPRSFEGLLSLSTRHGSISLSDPLLQNATQLGQVGQARRYFVGNFGLLGEEPWQGDEVQVEAVHGSVRVRYADEEPVGGKKGLLSRLFGK